MNLLYDCQSYEELAGPDDVYKMVIDAGPPEFKQLPSNWLLQLKQDGIWARVVIQNNQYEIFSKTGQLKKSGNLPQGLLISQPTVLIGEFMYGSQWSTHPDRTGRLYIFDCLVDNGKELVSLPYKDRYRAAVSQVLQLGQPFNILPCYSISKLGEMWLSLREKTEGFIIRRWSDSWNATLFKLKFEVEDDFVVMGAFGGTGKYAMMLGALSVGQYDETGKLQFVMNVGGGYTDKQRRDWWPSDPVAGKVILVRGKGRFNTGALRHPNFVRIRDDKLPTECILKREQSK